jgi:hypothetical protein
MRAFMRIPGPLCLAFFLILMFSSCGYGDHPNPAFSPDDRPPASPRLMQFAADIGSSWYPGYVQGMWKIEVVDQRPGGIVRTISEAQCPDRYRVTVTGAENSETIYIDKMMYHREGSGTWTEKVLPMRHMILASCNLAPPQELDPARLRILADQFRDEQIDGPVIREIAGHECREWTRNMKNFSKSVPIKTCYDIKTHAIVQAQYGNQTTTYFSGVKVNITPPN